MLQKPQPHLPSARTLPEGSPWLQEVAASDLVVCVMGVALGPWELPATAWSLHEQPSFLSYKETTLRRVLHQVLDQGPQMFSAKGPDSNYFRL